MFRDLKSHFLIRLSPLTIKDAVMLGLRYLTEEDQGLSVAALLLLRFLAGLRRGTRVKSNHKDYGYLQVKESLLPQCGFVFVTVL